MKLKGYFSKLEWILWLSSLTIITAFFLIFDRSNYLSLAASLIGVTSLIFCAKGNPVGQALMIIFGIMYGFISWGFAYYGEMMTYVGMTVPMAATSLVSWLKNPYKGNKSEVKVNRITKKELFVGILLSAAVTVVFWFILRAFNTANLIPSTFSVTTSFFSVYLTFRRSPYFALAYAANDVVLIILWIMATIKDFSYISVTVCFCVFLINDIYGFFSWKHMQKRQDKSGC